MGGWDLWIAIALGSAAGGVLRQAMTDAITALAGSGFPWGTWLVNVTGCAAIGACSALAAAGYPWVWNPVARHAAMTGLLGGFTTFSTFSVQTLALCQQGLWGTAAVYVLLSVSVCLGACWGAFAGVQALAR